MTSKIEGWEDENGLKWYTAGFVEAREIIAKADCKNGIAELKNQLHLQELSITAEREDYDSEIAELKRQIIMLELKNHNKMASHFDCCECAYCRNERLEKEIAERDEIIEKLKLMFRHCNIERIELNKKKILQEK